MFFLRQIWKDSRLAYQGLLDNPSITMKQHFVQHIWLPDAFFDKDLSDHKTREDLFVRIYQDGKIMYSLRYAVVGLEIKRLVKLIKTTTIYLKSK